MTNLIKVDGSVFCKKGDDLEQSSAVEEGSDN